MTEQIPKSEEIEFKDKFIDRYSVLTDFEKFKEYSLSFLRRSIRVNTLKISVKELVKRLEKKDWLLTPIPWCKEGFWIEHKGVEITDDEGNVELIKRRDVGNITEHTLGYFYIQEAASMIPPIVLMNPYNNNPSEKNSKNKENYNCNDYKNNNQNEFILDMCASPGSKTTQIGMYMKNQGILMANDYKYDRIKSLGLNVQRCGLNNCVITLMMGHLFSKMGIEKFDRILVDAPCSGTGTIRKSLKTLKIWNPNMVRRLCGQQRQLLETGFKLLKKGGTLVYSTCTLEPEEDEGVISWLLDKYDGTASDEKNKNDKDKDFIKYGKAVTEDIKLHGLNRSEPILEFEKERYNDGVSRCLRIWPQDNDTEGFFVCKIRKI
ncbi:MAG: tRNA methyltransferase [Candidatus Woesearchaeota archaeon]